MSDNSGATIGTHTSVHPSELYRSIHAQPAVIRNILGACREGAREAADMVRSARRTFVLGTGSSYHAAWAGEYLLRAAGAEAYAMTHFDFVNYPRVTHDGDLVISISHRGNKRYGVAAIERVLAQGLPLIGISGQGSPMQGPRPVLYTSPQEKSSTHTMSYTGDIVTLAMIAVGAMGPKGDPMDGALQQALGAVPTQIEEILRQEDSVLPAARHLSQRGRLFLAGAGMNAATAKEGALKVKESSYLVAEGFELETMLHGGLQALHPGDLTVPLVVSGPSLDRMGDLMRALSIIGTKPWPVGDHPMDDIEAEGSGRRDALPPFRTPSAPEVLSPLLTVIPLQLLACFTAELRGTNPDSFREDDPIFAKVSASYRL